VFAHIVEIRDAATDEWRVWDRYRDYSIAVAEFRRLVSLRGADCVRLRASDDAKNAAKR